MSKVMSKFYKILKYSTGSDANIYKYSINAVLYITYITYITFFQLRQKLIQLMGWDGVGW
jgi:hypothetical protein